MKGCSISIPSCMKSFSARGPTGRAFPGVACLTRTAERTSTRRPAKKSSRYRSGLPEASRTTPRPTMSSWASTPLVHDPQGHGRARPERKPGGLEPVLAHRDHKTLTDVGLAEAGGIGARAPSTAPITRTKARTKPTRTAFTSLAKSPS